MNQKHIVLNNLYRLANGNKFILTNMPEIATPSKVNNLLIIYDKDVKKETMLEFVPEKEIELSGLFLKFPENSAILYTNDEDYFDEFVEQIKLKGFVINRKYTISDILNMLAEKGIKITRQTLTGYVNNHLISKLDYKKGVKELTIYDSGLRKALNYYLKS